jgi:polyisoprenoid-binding protein YceI
MGGRRATPDATGLGQSVAAGFVTGALVGLLATLACVPLRRLGGVTDRSMVNGLSVVAASIGVWTAGGLLFGLFARRGRHVEEWLFSAAAAVAALVAGYIYLDAGPLTPYPTRFASLAVPLELLVLLGGAIVFRALVALRRPARLVMPAAAVAAVLALGVGTAVYATDRRGHVHYTLSKAPAVASQQSSGQSGITAGSGSTLAATQAPTPSPTPAGPLHFTVSSQTEASYTVHEKLVRLPGPSDAIGKTSAITGDLYLMPAGLAPSPPSTFTIDLRTLTSDAPPRDRYIRTFTLDTANFPTATFTITNVEGFPASYKQGDEVKLTITGTFNVHGVEKPLTWTGTARYLNNQLEAVMSTDFDMHDFNITPPVNSVATAESGVHLDLHLFAVQGS